MIDSRAVKITERYQRLKAMRSSHETTWQETAEYMRPIRNEFLGRNAQGDRRFHRTFDSSPLLAVDNFASGIYGMMTNPANRWFGLSMQDEDLADFEPVRKWLYEAETRLLDSFGPQVSRFYSVIPMLYADLACFGTSVFYSEEQPGSRRINDSVRPLSECCVSENEFGEVDTLYRRFSMEARNAVSMFEAQEGVSEATQKKATKNPYEPVWFIHCVQPNEAYVPNRIGRNSKQYESVYVEEEAKRIVGEGGYDEMPYHVPRWGQAAGETYGRGIGEMTLADVKSLNRMGEASLKVAQKTADPPLAAPDEGVIRALRTYPGGVTYGAVDALGNQLVKPLYTGGDHRITLEIAEQRRTVIREAFYFSLMQMVGSPDMTATEWLGRQEEKLRLMGPNLGRIQSEFLSPLIERRFGLLLRAGALPPPPPEIQGSTLNVEYVSPLARAQMAGEANAVNRLLQSVVPMVQIDPGVWDNIDSDEAVQVLGKGFAVNPKVLRGADERKQVRDQRIQSQQMQAMTASAEPLSGALKNVAQAQQVANQGA